MLTKPIDGLDGYLLTDLVLNEDDKGSPRLVDCESVTVSPEVRLYWRATHSGLDGRVTGFEFCSVTWVSGLGKSRDDLWRDDEILVGILLRGVACWDGVRHLRLNVGEDAGYVYCPDLYALQRVLAELQRLEDRFCAPRDHH